MTSDEQTIVARTCVDDKLEQALQIVRQISERYEHGIKTAETLAALRRENMPPVSHDARIMPEK